MKQPGEVTEIMGCEARFHSMYKGWEIYRRYVGNQPKMCYFAVGIPASNGLTILDAENLASIKAKVTEIVDYEKVMG